MAQQVFTELIIDSDTSGADRFSAGMDKASASAQQGIDSAAGMTLAIAGVGAAFVGALVGLRSFFDYVGQQNKLLVDIEENARSAGMTMRDFQETLFAARSKGLTEKDFVSGLDKITTDLTAASSGVTEFGRLFEANGLKIKNANGELKTAKQALGDIMGLVQDASPEVARGVTKIVGISKDWIPFLRQATEELDRQKKAASDLGLVINDDVIAKAKEFDSQWKTAIATWDLQFKASLAGIMPLLVKMATLASTIIDGVGSVNSSVSRWLTPDEDKSKAQLNDQINQVAKLRDMMESLATTGGEFKKFQVANLAELVGLSGDATIKDVDALLTKLTALYDKTPTKLTVNAPGSTVLPANDNKDSVDRAINSLFKHTEAQKADAASVGLGARAHAELRAEAAMTAAVQANGGKITQEQANAFIWLKLAAGGAAEALAQAKINSQIDFSNKTKFLSSEDVAIAQQLSAKYGNDVPRALASTEAAQIRVISAQKLVGDGFRDIGESVVSAALKGGNAMAALMSGLDGLAAKMAKGGFNNAVDGLLTGNLAQAGLGAAQMAGSAIISAFTGDQKKQEELRKARAEWEKAGPAFSTFLKQMSGGVQGNLSQQIQEASAREADFEDKAWKARDTAAINAARAGLQKFSDTQKLLFQATFQATIDALNDGLGLDSPFMKAVNNVKTALNAQLAFIDDTDVAIGENIPGTMAKTRAASQSYLLSLLQQPQALSAVQTGMMQIRGAANALQGALVQLGLSSGDAAAKINEGVTKAIAGLKTQFEAGLTERLNSATGQGFLNDATKLIAQHQQDLLDAASMGSDPALVASLFRAEAQKIIDDAELTGDAFKGFIAKFSPLKDIVHEFTQSAVDDSKALRDAQNTAAKSIVEFVNGLYAGPNSTDSPTQRRAAAGTVYNAQLALAQANDPGAQARITQDAQNLLDAERAISASSEAFQLLKDNVAAQLLSLPAVQNTTDPATQVMRDVLTAVNISNQTLRLINIAAGGTIDAVNATKDAVGSTTVAVASSNSVGTLTNVILPAVNAGSASAIAANLQAYFAYLGGTQGATTDAVNSGNFIADAKIVPAVNAGNASAIGAVLQGYFNQIDPTGKLASVVFNTLNAANLADTITKQNDYQTNLFGGQNSATKAAVDSAKSAMDTNNALVTAGNNLVISSNNFLTGINTFTDRIIQAINSQGFMQAGNFQQMILNSAVLLNWMPKLVTPQYENAGGGGGGSSGSIPYTAHASGGVIPPYGLGLVSEHLNPTFLRAGAEPITVSPFAPQMPFNDNRPINVAAPVFRGGGGNSNAELIAEVKALRKELEQLRNENNGGNAQLSRAVLSGAVHVGEKVDRVAEVEENLLREEKFKKASGQ
jgi:hypothetical protein